MAIKLINKTKSILLVSALVIALVGGGLSYYFSQHTPTAVDCSDIKKKTDAMVRKKHYKEAYNYAKPYINVCSKGVNDKEYVAKAYSKVSEAEFTASIAKAAYSAGYKAAAEKYAKSYLEKNDKLTVEERSKIRNQAVLFFDMQTIQHGFYVDTSDKSEVKP